ncbi:MIZ/SP-RING zinc finger-domain-containing protein [Phycomyces nitens]|nr:MIZ/SP-RING zinc finger-domain-containing protein [Phycomyces nitens]
MTLDTSFIKNSKNKIAGKNNRSSNFLATSQNMTNAESSLQARIKSSLNEDYPYIQRIDYAIKPFKLVHNQKWTKMDFEYTEKIRTNLLRKYSGSSGSHKDLPISYVLTSWREDDPPSNQRKTTESDEKDKKCEWPQCVDITVNRQKPPIIKRMKLVTKNRSGETVTSYTGKDFPCDITYFLHNGTNSILLVQNECACSYRFAVQAIVRDKANSIVKTLATRLLDMDKGKKSIDRLLGSVALEDENDEILMRQESVKLSLRCPISFVRIELPVKGINCLHPDCFDLTSYLATNGNNLKWKCPHCNKYAPPNELIRDMFFEFLLKKVPRNARQIEFTESSDSWMIAEAEDEDDFAGDEDYPDGDTNVKPKTPAKDITTNVISLLSDDEDEEQQSSLGQRRGRDASNDSEERQKMSRFS